MPCLNSLKIQESQIIISLSLFAEVVRAMNFLLNQGLIMYWGTARWSPFEIFEAYSIVTKVLMQHDDLLAITNFKG